MDKIFLTSISEEELFGLIQKAVNEAVNRKQEKELLNFKETCNFIGISSSSLHKYKSKNLIPYRKLGKRIFFNRNDVMKAMNEAGHYIKQKNL
jgi:hypothetical protein